MDGSDLMYLIGGAFVCAGVIVCTGGALGLGLGAISLGAGCILLGHGFKTHNDVEIGVGFALAFLGVALAVALTPLAGAQGLTLANVFQLN